MENVWVKQVEVTIQVEQVEVVVPEVAIGVMGV